MNISVWCCTEIIAYCLLLPACDKKVLLTWKFRFWYSRQSMSCNSHWLVLLQMSWACGFIIVPNMTHWPQDNVNPGGIEGCIEWGTDGGDCLILSLFSASFKRHCHELNLFRCGTNALVHLLPWLMINLLGFNLLSKSTLKCGSLCDECS